MGPKKLKIWAKSLFLAIIDPGMLKYHNFRVLFEQYTPHVYIITNKDRYHQKNRSIWTNGSSKVADLAKKA